MSLFCVAVTNSKAVYARSGAAAAVYSTASTAIPAVSPPPSDTPLPVPAVPFFVKDTPSNHSPPKIGQFDTIILQLAR